jgi:hypothetical protein
MIEALFISAALATSPINETPFRKREQIPQMPAEIPPRLNLVPVLGAIDIRRKKKNERDGKPGVPQFTQKKNGTRKREVKNITKIEARHSRAPRTVRSFSW